MLNKSIIFEVEDLVLGKIALDEDEENWFLYLETRNLQVSKKTGEIVERGSWISRDSHPRFRVKEELIKT